jgi:hypothetical protein
LGVVLSILKGFLSLNNIQAISQQSMMGFGGFWAPPYGMPPMMPPQSDSAPSTCRTNSVEPSSDPPDAAAASIYPLIETFMESLVLWHPQRNLDGIGMFFMSNDYFHIDGVLGLTQDEVMKLGFGMYGQQG